MQSSQDARGVRGVHDRVGLPQHALGEVPGEHYYVEPVVERQVAEDTDRSVGWAEFEFASVSAVLRDLELYYVRDYRPQSNYRQALSLAVEAELVERLLSKHTGGARG